MKKAHQLKSKSRRGIVGFGKSCKVLGKSCKKINKKSVRPLFESRKILFPYILFGKKPSPPFSLKKSLPPNFSKKKSLPPNFSKKKFSLPVDGPDPDVQ